MAARPAVADARRLQQSSALASAAEGSGARAGADALQQRQQALQLAGLGLTNMRRVSSIGKRLLRQKTQGDLLLLASGRGGDGLNSVGSLVGSAVADTDSDFSEDDALSASSSTLKTRSALQRRGLDKLAETFWPLRSLQAAEIDRLALVGSRWPAGTLVEAEPANGIVLVDSGAIEIRLFGRHTIVEVVPPGECIFSPLMLLGHLCQSRPSVRDSQHPDARVYLRAYPGLQPTSIRFLSFRALCQALNLSSSSFSPPVNPVSTYCWRQFSKVFVQGLLPVLVPDETNASGEQQQTGVATTTACGLWGSQRSDAVEARLPQLARILELPEDRFKAAVSVTECKPGDAVAKAGDRLTCLYFVLRGRLWQRVGAKPISVAGPGEFFGMVSYCGQLPLASDIYCRSAAVLARLDPASLASEPRLLAACLARVSDSCLGSISPLVRTLDYALRFVSLKCGASLASRTGVDDPHCHFLLSGRLLLSGQSEYYGRGRIINLVAALNRSQCPLPAESVRDSELIRLSRHLVSFLSQRFQGFSHLLVSTLANALLDSYSSQASSSCSRPQSSPVKTVAVIPAQGYLPAASFAGCLAGLLPPPVRHLSSELVCRKFHKSVWDLGTRDDALHSWLTAGEEENDFVIFAADYELTPWTLLCIRQADIILVLSDHDGPPAPCLTEHFCTRYSRAQIELLLLHPKRRARVPPGSTAPFLAARPWVRQHLHLRLPDSLRLHRTRRVSLRVAPDMRRLARRLTGASIGLALGGGGARGAAHPAVIKLLCDRRVPIDALSGTSIGSLMASLWAMDTSLESLMYSSKKTFSEAGSLLMQLLDMTLPLVSFFRGGLMNRLVLKLFDRDLNIEDLWLPCYFVATDLQSCRMRVMTRGRLWKAVRASMSYPIILPPIWSDDGDLLVDGCFVNNLPADVLRYQFGAAKVVAVDISESSSLEQGGYRVYGDSLSGFRAFLARGGTRYPSLIDVQLRLASITSSMNVRQHNLQEATWCWYLTPPVHNYSISSFSSFQLIYEVASAYAEAKWKEDSASAPAWFAELLSDASDSPAAAASSASGGVHASVNFESEVSALLQSIRLFSAHEPAKGFVEDSAIAANCNEIGGEMELEPETSAPLFQLRSATAPAYSRTISDPGLSVVEPISYGRDAAAQLQCCSTAGILF
ncbi:hypothetical protein BOX15_Mlig027371g4 [Macrostomum lignano]|uniref:Patatin n=2 Tax=Macrostomum lignano TaxID=282301 RepID=A0A267E2S7_9PLAT|nr:hypothetical protein BOX15_Mlig027371g4 [Macrostomum lignano]